MNGTMPNKTYKGLGCSLRDCLRQSSGSSYIQLLVIITRSISQLLHGAYAKLLKGIRFPVKHCLVNFMLLPLPQYMEI